ncbi:MAG: glycoside hydrolase family 5 protein [Fibrobacterales bacterium]
MKKFYTTLLAITLASSLSACLGTTVSDNNSSSSAEESSTDSSEVYSSTEESSFQEFSSEEESSTEEMSASGISSESLESSNDNLLSSEELSSSIEVSSSSSVEKPLSSEALSSSSEKISSSSEPEPIDFGEKYGAPEGSPVALHGRLSTDAHLIVGEDGLPVQLIGMSLFWSQWQGDFYNEDVINWLVKDWKIDVVRAAMGVDHEKGGGATGYTIFPDIEFAKVEAVVQAAIDNGIYVIVDWHDHFANHPEQWNKSKEFFDMVSKKYKDIPNVIYEIFNEPTSVGPIDWNMDPSFNWASVEPYMDEIIQVIRANDPFNHIVIGSPTWSSEPFTAATSVENGKINDPENNFSFTMHFYAKAHKEGHRENSQKTMDLGYPVFATEWGTSDAVKQESIDVESTKIWIDFMKDPNRMMSWCNWAISDKHNPGGGESEANGALYRGAPTDGNWGPEHLTESGKLIRSILREAHGEVGDSFPN